MVVLPGGQNQFKTFGPCDNQIQRRLDDSKLPARAVWSQSDASDNVASTKYVVGIKVSDMQKNVIPGRRKGCPDYSPD
ncbi:hypothetical protein [Enterobacter cloacae]|uniref:hypothetical protein n=1 Tax=Enterobacter cloacae TaxID=550 RepID=UPI0013D83DED|nr:hypothetical protein [Enterobacter cloacae]